MAGRGKAEEQEAQRMAKAQGEREVATFEQSAGVLKLVPPKRLRLPLRNADDILAEMARTYRAVKQGTLDRGDGSSRMYMLSLMGRVIEMTIIERRLNALERQQDE